MSNFKAVKKNTRGSGKSKLIFTVIWNVLIDIRTILVSVKIFAAILGPVRKWLRQFYGRLEKCVLSAGKTHAHRIPRLKGGCILGFGGMGGEVPILVLWARGVFR